MTIDERLSDKAITTIIAGGYTYIILPDGTGGWISHRILISSLLSAVNSSISSLQSYQSQATTTVKEKSKSTAFTTALPADTALDGVDFIWVSGTPNVKVGTTSGANDIISGRTPTNGSPSRNALNKYWLASQTLFFTITGGVVDIIINYRKDYNS